MDKNKTAPQKNKVPESANGKSMKFLPIVFTSQVARNRLDQMKSQINMVKSMNPHRFYPQPPIMNTNEKKQ